MELSPAFWKPGDVAPSTPASGATVVGIPGTKSASASLLQAHGEVVIRSSAGLHPPAFAAALGVHLAELWCHDDPQKRRVLVSLPTSEQASARAEAAAIARRIDSHRVGADWIGVSTVNAARVSPGLALVFCDHAGLFTALSADPVLSRTAAVVLATGPASEAAEVAVALVRLAARARPALRIALVGFPLPGPADPVVEATALRPVAVRFAESPVDDAVTAATSAAVEAVRHLTKSGSASDAAVLVFGPGPAAARSIAEAVDTRFRREAAAARGRRKPRVRTELVGPGLGIWSGAASASGAVVRVAGCDACALMGLVRASVVVDTGLREARTFSQGVWTVGISGISRGEADLRSSFAGTGEHTGLCLRLYTRNAFEALPPRSAPALLEGELSGTVLQLKRVGVDDVAHFDYAGPPPDAPRLAAALGRLRSLGALSSSGTLTTTGHAMARLPFDDPALAAAVVAARRFGVNDETLAIACVLQAAGSARAIFASTASRRPFAAAEGDLVTALNAFDAFRAASRQGEWCRARGLIPGSLRRARSMFTALRARSPSTSTEVSAIVGRGVAERVCRALAAGLCVQAARSVGDGWYETTPGGVRARLHPGSVLAGAEPEWVVYGAAVRTDGTFLRDVTIVRGTWLAESAPDFFKVSAEDGMFT